ncbi:MAG: putative peptidoglycan binding domain [Pseudonocardiales bacterium]|jgi:peptidoglycan hydrolase-like protein with peptidoglycan-binding domain|nr:putative peptidoglycan binding domain [Pseudonocardiales bacterium]
MFGPSTRIAVLDFQGRHGLPADGNVGGATADMILASLPQVVEQPPVSDPPDDPGTEPGMVTRCHGWGGVVCDYYVSREATKQMLELFNSDANPSDLLASTACTIGGGENSPVCKTAEFAIQAGEWAMKKKVEQAVNQNACLKMTYIKWAASIKAPLVDNGEFCRDR